MLNHIQGTAAAWNAIVKRSEPHIYLLLKMYNSLTKNSSIDMQVLIETDICFIWKAVTKETELL